MARILICEDESAQRAFYQTVQEKAAYEITAAASGAEALEALQQVDVDIMVMDIRMPDMHGLELLEALRRKDRRLPVIVASAMQALKDSFEVKTYGVGAFLAKPVDVKDLLETVDRLVAQHTHS